MGSEGYFPGGKAAGAWSWPLTSNLCRDQEYVDLYIHSPVRLHGVSLLLRLMELMIVWNSDGSLFPCIESLGCDECRRQLSLSCSDAARCVNWHIKPGFMTATHKIRTHKCIRLHSAEGSVTTSSCISPYPLHLSWITFLFLTAALATLILLNLEVRWIFLLIKLYLRY
jgi:hypothetical protein